MGRLRKVLFSTCSELAEMAAKVVPSSFKVSFFACQNHYTQKGRHANHIRHDEQRKLDQRGFSFAKWEKWLPLPHSINQSMVKNTTRKVKQLLKSLLQEGHIDDMTAKWLSLTPNPPRIPIFYTLTKIHKPTPVERPIISGCDGPTERMSAFIDRLIQSISQKQDWYVKDKTDFLNFIESAKLRKNTFVVSMGVTSLYTNLPQEGDVNTICYAYEDFFLCRPSPNTHKVSKRNALFYINRKLFPVLR